MRGADVQGGRLRPSVRVSDEETEGEMAHPMTIDEFCSTVYGPGWDSEPEKKKSKRDTVSRMCRDGVLDAFKVGRRWLIRLEGDGR